PIAVADVVRYLVGVLDEPRAKGKVFEIGGPEVLQYVTMLRRVAAIKNRRLLILPVPLLSPGLSSRWLALVTDVDTQAGRSLVDSMTNEVVVRTDSIRSLVPLQTMGYDEAVRTALREHEELKDPTSTSQRTSAWLRRARSALELRLPMSIRHVVPIEHPEPASAVSRRRRVVAGVSLLGTGLLGLSLSTKPNSKEFYGLTAAVAATWISGGLLSGPLHLGWIQSRDQQLRRPIVTPVATGVGAFAFFYGCALVARSIPSLDQAIGKVLTFAEEGSSPMIVATTLANGLGEEVFFRGALYAAVDADRAVVVSTAVYTLATASTRNPALMLAAAVMGTLFSLQRRASGGLQAPVLTHLTWSTLMVRYLPPLFRRAHGDVS
ncbi:MAG: CPBP family glutamic-type intramembrane protease, partial [Sporichthyaceae bacterium]